MPKFFDDHIDTVYSIDIDIDIDEEEEKVELGDTRLQELSVEYKDEEIILQDGKITYSINEIEQPVYDDIDDHPQAFFSTPEKAYDALKKMTGELRETMNNMKMEGEKKRFYESIEKIEDSIQEQIDEL